MRKTVSTAEAKTHFAELLRSAEAGDIVAIARDGKPVAAIISIRVLEQLRGAQTVVPREGLQSLLGRWDDGAELATELDRVVAARKPGNKTASTSIP